MNDTPDRRDDEESPEDRPTEPMSSDEPEDRPVEPPHLDRDHEARAQASTAGGWVPPGGGYVPGPDDPSAGASFTGERPTAALPRADDGPRRLRRSTSDRMIAGVSGGLGRYFDIDPVLFRIAFVVLTLAGGAGLLAYLGLWLVTPSDGEHSEPTGTRALAVIGGIVLLLVCLPFLFVGAFLAIPLLPLTLLVLVIILLARGARGKGDGDTSDVIARVALVLLILVVSIAAFFAAAAGAALGGGAVIAGIVVALGLALVAAAFAGESRARWLLLPALVLAVPLGIIAASGLDLRGGMGERDYRPTSLAELNPRYKLGAGEMKIDLRDMQIPEGTTPLNVKMGAGHVVVYVPQHVCVSSRVKVGVGYAQVLGRDSGGIDVDWPNVRRPPVGTPTIDLNANLGVGALEVRHSDAEGQIGHDFHPIGPDACLPN
jgi:phage shock protein PspC (stress-responsive transcriptional regulator)